MPGQQVAPAVLFSELAGPWVPQGPSPGIANGVEGTPTHRGQLPDMGHNIFFGNLPTWVTADDIRSWLESSDLVCDAVRVIRDFETQESKGYAFVEAPNEEEMVAIIRRFNRAPIDGKLLRAKAAHPKGDRSRQRKPRPRRRPVGPRVRRDSGRKPQVGALGEALQKAL